jgi:glycosyltransferase involved in cell wall biosynthesis
MKKRVAIVVGVPTPYRDHLFERLARSADYDIQALYCRDHQPSQGWRLGAPLYPARCLRNLAPAGWHERLLIGGINPGVRRGLRAFRPDAVIVYGYNALTTLLAVHWASKRRIPVLMRSDSNVLEEDGKPPLVLAFKRLFLRWLTSRVYGFLSVGTTNSQYWLHYGANPKRIFLARYAVDNEYFSRQAARYRARREQIRDENGWRQRYLLLYVGRLVPVKGVEVLIDAVRRICKVRADIGLLIVGEGPERRALEKRARNLPQVFFLGFRDWNQLPKFYAAADLFVLPSVREPWGLVVNEAMASGLPVIATRKVGAAQDLIIEGQNGYLVPASDAEAMASAIDRACQSEERLRTLGEGARPVIASWNYDATLSGFYQALASCLGSNEA